MKKSKSQFEKWFDSQFKNKPEGNYYKLLDRRATLLSELAVIEAQLSRHEIYDNCKYVANLTRRAAIKKYKF